MFLLSYLLHGVFLNDLQRLSYPLGIFLTGASVVYLLLGFVLAKIYQLIPMHISTKKISHKPILRGIISGVALGFFVYLTALIIGVSFNTSPTALQILFDLSWQIAEQTAGGITVGIVYIWVYEGDPVNVFSRKILGE